MSRPPQPVATEAERDGWRKRLWSHQFVRFMLVGAGNTVFGYSLYLLGLLIGLPYQVAVAASTVLGALFNFFTTGRIVFANDKWHRIFGFLLVYGIVLAANIGLLAPLVAFGMNKALAQAALMPGIVILSFILNKYLIFGRRS